MNFMLFDAITRKAEENLAIRQLCVTLRLTDLTHFQGRNIYASDILVVFIH